jgi:hypothetical protein
MGQGSDSATTGRFDPNEEKDKVRWGTRSARLRLVAVKSVRRLQNGTLHTVVAIGYPDPYPFIDLVFWRSALDPIFE